MRAGDVGHRIDNIDTAVKDGVRRKSTKWLSKLALMAYDSNNRRGVKGSLMDVRGRERRLRSSLLLPGWSMREESKMEEWIE